MIPVRWTKVRTHLTLGKDAPLGRAAKYPRCQDVGDQLELDHLGRLVSPFASAYALTRAGRHGWTLMAASFTAARELVGLI
jgi:hypothetical protein